MSYQQWTRFRTTVDFDHEYLRNGISNRQVENGVINQDIFYVRCKQFGELWWLVRLRKNEIEKMKLKNWPWNWVGF